MHRLLHERSSAALRGVLKRFDANASSHIADEEEKQFLEDALVELGEISIEPLRAFIQQGKQLSYALRAFKRLVGQSEATQFFLKVLNDYGPEDHRNGDAKLQLVLHIQDGLQEPEQLERLLPFLTDHSDDVQWQLFELLQRLSATDAADAKQTDLLTEPVRSSASDLLGQVLFDPHTGPRIRRRCADFLADVEWPASGDETALDTLLSEHFFLDKKRFMRRRSPR